MTAPFAYAAALVLLAAASPAQRLSAPDRVGATPVGDSARWFGPQDVPADALAARTRDFTTYSLMINARGRVETCYIKTSSGSHRLDQAGCWLLIERGRFRLGAGYDGKAATGGSAELRVSWTPAAT